jgi:hypothetical protein
MYVSIEKIGYMADIFLSLGSFGFSTISTTRSKWMSMSDILFRHKKSPGTP